jgi:solute carrier family 25 2-oxodicarboxylate transporter 21
MPPPKPKPKPTRLTATQEIVAGFAAGVADAVACHPVDVVKTRAHVNRGANAPFVRELARQVRSYKRFSPIARFQHLIAFPFN